MKAYRVVLLIVDLDEIGEDCIRQELECTRYANRCISPEVKHIEGKDIGEWHDGHPLNLRDQADKEYARIFGILD